MSTEEERALAYRQSQVKRMSWIQGMRARLAAPTANRLAVEKDWEPMLDYVREKRSDAGQVDPAGGPERSLRGIPLP